VLYAWHHPTCLNVDSFFFGAFNPVFTRNFWCVCRLWIQDCHCCVNIILVLLVLLKPCLTLFYVLIRCLDGMSYAFAACEHDTASAIYILCPFREYIFVCVSAHKISVSLEKVNSELRICVMRTDESISFCFPRSVLVSFCRFGGSVMSMLCALTSAIYRLCQFR